MQESKITGRITKLVKIRNFLNILEEVYRGTNNTKISIKDIPVYITSGEGGSTSGRSINIGLKSKDYVIMHEFTHISRSFPMLNFTHMNALLKMYDDKLIRKINSNKKFFLSYTKSCMLGAEISLLIRAVQSYFYENKDYIRLKYGGSSPIAGLDIIVRESENIYKLEFTLKDNNKFTVSSPIVDKYNNTGFMTFFYLNSPKSDELIKAVSRVKYDLMLYPLFIGLNCSEQDIVDIVNLIKEKFYELLVVMEESPEYIDHSRFNELYVKVYKKQKFFYGNVSIKDMLICIEKTRALVDNILLLCEKNDEIVKKKFVKKMMDALFVINLIEDRMIDSFRRCSMSPIYINSLSKDISDIKRKWSNVKNGTMNSIIKKFLVDNLMT